MKVRANGLSLPDLDTLAALETGRYWTPAKRPSEPSYRPAINNGYWAEDILTNGLVLYVPAWLYSGAKFPSVDAYHHTCTATSPTWGLQGRTFDGNDNITIPWTDTSILTNCTIELWISRASWALPATEEEIMQIGDTPADGDNAMYLSFHPVVGLHFRSGIVTGGNYIAYNMASEATGYHHVIITKAGTVATIVVDGDEKVSGTVATITVVNNPLYIGTWEDTTLGLNALIGEARIYNRALSLAGAQHNRSVTRWRYA
jgi:hypothetical protein